MREGLEELSGGARKLLFMVREGQRWTIHTSLRVLPPLVLVAALFVVSRANGTGSERFHVPAHVGCFSLYCQCL